MSQSSEARIFAGITTECDKLFNTGNSAGVERFLLEHLSAAESNGHRYLQLFLQSELMGHYRMKGDTLRSLHAVESGMTLLKQLSDLDPISRGTILINAGTALSAAGKLDEALAVYQQAGKSFSGVLKSDDYLQAGLLNNMASVYAAQADITSAERCYLDALDILKSNRKYADSAVTCVNLAQLYAQRSQDDPLISVMLECAMEFLDTPALPRDGYYAHTCSKCIPVFEFLGETARATELHSRIKEIYERN